MIAAGGTGDGAVGTVMVSTWQRHGLPLGLKNRLSVVLGPQVDRKLVCGGGVDWFEASLAPAFLCLASL